MHVYIKKRKGLQMLGKSFDAEGMIVLLRWLV